MMHPLLNGALAAGLGAMPALAPAVRAQPAPRVIPLATRPMDERLLGEGRPSSVTLGFGAGDGARVRGLEVYSRAAADVGEWAGAASCRPGGGDREILDCRFVSRPVAALQLILHVSGSAPLVLSRIELR